MAADSLESSRRQACWVFLRVHPAVPKSVRTARPRDLLPRAVGPIGQVREPDGLEAILRLAALWQRVGAKPLRQTRQGVLVLQAETATGLTSTPSSPAPIANSLVPLPDSPSLWLALARRVGWVEPNPAANASSQHLKNIEPGPNFTLRD